MNKAPAIDSVGSTPCFIKKQPGT